MWPNKPDCRCKRTLSKDRKTERKGDFVAAAAFKPQSTPSMVRKHLEKPGNTWKHLEKPGNIWKHLEKTGVVEHKRYLKPADHV